MSYLAELDRGYIADILSAIREAFKDQPRPDDDRFVRITDAWDIESANVASLLRSHTPESLAEDWTKVWGVPWSLVTIEAYSYYAITLLTTNCRDLNGPGVTPVNACLWVYDDSSASFVREFFKTYSLDKIMALRGYCELFAKSWDLIYVRSFELFWRDIGTNWVQS